MQVVVGVALLLLLFSNSVAAVCDSCGGCGIPCWIGQALCTAYTLPFTAVTYTIRTYCTSALQPQSDEDRQLFQDALDILVDYGYFEASEYEGVDLRFCDWIVWGGMAPTPDTVVLGNQFRTFSAFDLASNIVAHEMFREYFVVKCLFLFV